MQTILRERCAVTGGDDLEPLHKVSNAPVVMGCVAHAPLADIVADMDWWINGSSGLIQLRRLLTLEVVYPASHGAGAVGAMRERHHRSFARFVHQRAPAAVLEIGGAHGILALEPGLAPRNRALYAAYLESHTALIERINARIASAKAVYMFGAHAMSQYLIAFGLDVGRVAAVLDNDPRKQGLRLYGTALTVRAPAVLKQVHAPLVILRAGVFAEEIKRDILDNINPGCVFLE